MTAASDPSRDTQIQLVDSGNSLVVKSGGTFNVEAGGVLWAAGQPAAMVFTNAGGPTNGTSGTLAGIAGKGMLLLDTTNGALYQNTNTLASPTWTLVEAAGGSPTFNQVTVNAGTASVAPINLTAGTNLTTPAAGAMEFDGTAFYATAVASARQQLDAEQYTIASSDSATYSNTGLDASAAAAVFTATMGGSANGAVTLAAGKTYCFEACYNLTNTGTTSHTWAALFGGTATITAAQFQAFGISGGTANTPATGGLTGFFTGTDLTNGGSGVVVTAASTSATEQVTIQLTGTLVIANAGTLIPQLKASARPGASGTPGVVVKKGSFFRIWEMAGTGTVGNWS